MNKKRLSCSHHPRSIVIMEATRVMSWRLGKRSTRHQPYGMSLELFTSQFMPPLRMEDISLSLGKYMNISATIRNEIEKILRLVLVGTEGVGPHCVKIRRLRLPLQNSEQRPLTPL